jgi:hypothetical protein
VLSNMVVTNQVVHFCSFWENLVEKQVTFFKIKKTCASVLQYHQALDCFVFGIGEQRLIAHHLPDSIMELFALTGC